MAKNTKRKARSHPRRESQPSVSPQPVSSQRSTSAVDFSTVRRSSSTKTVELDPNPGISLAQVPYFTGDLLRLGVVAGLMVVILVAGAQLIPLLSR